MFISSSTKLCKEITMIMRQLRHLMDMWRRYYFTWHRYLADLANLNRQPIAIRIQHHDRNRQTNIHRHT